MCVYIYIYIYIYLMKNAVKYRIRLSRAWGIFSPSSTRQRRRKMVQHRTISQPTHCRSIARYHKASLPCWPRKHIPTYKKNKTKLEFKWGHLGVHRKLRERERDQSWGSWSGTSIIHSGSMSCRANHLRASAPFSFEAWQNWFCYLDVNCLSILM